MSIYKLENTIQEYEWGSIDAIPQLLGYQNTEGKPQAELWMGAHPKAPSKVCIGEARLSLPDHVAANPKAVLGKKVAKRFDNSLPFLMKVLAAGAPLSIQAHPDIRQARRGFRLENRKGTPVDAPNRNYRDENHKPEILCALSPFWAMCGFRPIPELVEELLRLKKVPAMAGYAEMFDKAPSTRSLRTFFHTLLAMEKKEAGSIVPEVIDCLSGSKEPRHRWVSDLSSRYPGDVGALSPLFLNVLELQPRQAIYLPAGELHAYLSGIGIELMANSDNVLRGGLTQKHIDVPELQKTLTFSDGIIDIVEGISTDGCKFIYPTPAKEFLMARIDLRGQYRSEVDRNIEVGICISGSCTIEGTRDGDFLDVVKGDSFLIPADAAAYKIEGTAELFISSVPAVG